MPSPSKRATPAEKRGLSPETAAERDAKRRHTESRPLDDDPDTTIKDEDLPDGENPGATSSNLLQVGPVLDSLDESIRVLASFFPAYESGLDLVQGAFQTVLKRRLVESAADNLVPDEPKLSLEQWLDGYLQRLSLPNEHYIDICTALQKAELAHRVESWKAKHGPNTMSAALELLQATHSFGGNALPDVIDILRASEQQAEIEKSQKRSPSKAAVAKKVSRAAKVSNSASKVTKPKAKTKTEAAPKSNVGALALLTTKGDYAQRIAADEKFAEIDGVPTVRSKCMPSPSNKSHQPKLKTTFQISPSSSPALMGFLREHDTSPRQHPRKTIARNSVEPDLKAIKEATPTLSPPSRSGPRSSMLLRYVKPDQYNLLLFFIGPAVDDGLHKVIGDACWGAFGRRPIVSKSWSGSIWVAQIHGISGVFTNVLTVNGMQLTAAEACSDHQSHFVACCSDFEIESEVLAAAVEKEIVGYHPKKSSGQITIYRTSRTADHAEYVFLVLQKPPPKSLLPILIPNAVSGDRYLLFKPTIMDADASYFYCDQTHDGFVCPDAGLVAQFRVPAKR